MNAQISWSQPDTEKSNGHLGFITTMVGAVSVVLTTLLTVHPPIGQTNFVVLVTLLAASIVVLVLYGMLGLAVSQTLSSLRTRQIKNRLTKNNLDAFKSLVNQFGRLMNTDRTDGMPYLLKELRRTPGLDGPYALDPCELVGLFYNLQRRLEGSSEKYEHFSVLLCEFETLVRIYHDNCIRTPLSRAKDIDRDTIPSHLKESYRNGRQKYEYFIQRYMEFSGKLNAQFPEPISRAYFADLPEL